MAELGALCLYQLHRRKCNLFALQIHFCAAHSPKNWADALGRDLWLPWVATNSWRNLFSVCNSSVYCTHSDGILPDRRCCRPSSCGVLVAFCNLLSCDCPLPHLCEFLQMPRIYVFVVDICWPLDSRNFHGIGLYRDSTHCYHWDFIQHLSDSYKQFLGWNCSLSNDQRWNDYLGASSDLANLFGCDWIRTEIAKTVSTT